MAGKPLRIGPVDLTEDLTTAIFRPPALSGGVGVSLEGTFGILRHVRVLNKTSSAVTVSLAILIEGQNVGTGTLWQGKIVPANDAVDWYGGARINAGETLVGGAGVADSLVLQIEGDLHVA